MAKTRVEVCKYYIAFGQCAKGREAIHSGYCQRCDKYEPRSRRRHPNKKKMELEHMKIKEMI